MDEVKFICQPSVMMAPKQILHSKNYKILSLLESMILENFCLQAMCLAVSTKIALESRKHLNL